MEQLRKIMIEVTPQEYNQIMSGALSRAYKEDLSTATYEQLMTALISKIDANYEKRNPNVRRDEENVDNPRFYDYKNNSRIVRTTRSVTIENRKTYEIVTVERKIW